MSRGGASDQPGECVVHLQRNEGDLVREITVLDPDCERVLLRGRRTSWGVRITCSEDELEELLGFVAFEANHEERRPRQRRLDEVYAKLERALSG